MQDSPIPVPKQLKGRRRYNDRGERWCSRCRVFLPVDQFGLSKAIADGLNIYCRVCQAAHSNAWRNKDPERAKAFAAERERRWRANNPELMRQQALVRRRALKRQVLEAYGMRCTCCGESQYEFLSLDHINDDGNIHRREVGLGTGIYHWAKKHAFPPSLQILCYNCNFAKGSHGYCPHQGVPEIQPVMLRRPRTL